MSATPGYGMDRLKIVSSEAYPVNGEFTYSRKRTAEMKPRTVYQLSLRNINEAGQDMVKSKKQIDDDHDDDTPIAEIALLRAKKLGLDKYKKSLTKPATPSADLDESLTKRPTKRIRKKTYSVNRMLLLHQAFFFNILGFREINISWICIRFNFCFRY